MSDLTTLLNAYRNAETIGERVDITGEIRALFKAPKTTFSRDEVSLLMLHAFLGNPMSCYDDGSHKFDLISSADFLADAWLAARKS